MKLLFLTCSLFQALFVESSKQSLYVDSHYHELESGHRNVKKERRFHRREQHIDKNEDFFSSQEVKEESIDDIRARFAKRKQSLKFEDNGRDHELLNDQLKRHYEIENRFEENKKQLELHQDIVMKKFDGRKVILDHMRMQKEGQLDELGRNQIEYPRQQEEFDFEYQEFMFEHPQNEEIFDTQRSFSSQSQNEESGSKRFHLGESLRGGDHLNHPRVIEAQERLVISKAMRNERGLSKIDKRIARISKHAEKQGFDDEKMQRIQAELQAVLNDEGAEGEEEERTEARLERLRKVEFEVMGHTDPHGHRDIRGDFRDQMKSMHGDL